MIVLGGVTFYHAVNRYMMYDMKVKRLPVNNSNVASFEFIPNRNGVYSLDRVFANAKLVKQYDQCDFPRLEKEVNDDAHQAVCQNALIYRRISGSVNKKIFSLKPNVPTFLDDEVVYGISYNYALPNQQNLLHIQTFDVKRNQPVLVKLKIDADNQEIAQAKSTLVVGPSDPDGNAFYILFLVFAFPFLVSALLTWRHSFKIRQ